MAAPSSSCEVVDLALAASRDDASSKFFFSRDGGGDLSWPAAAGISSALTNQKSLVALCGKYGVPRELKPVCADTLRCGVCETPPEGLAPSQLGPNAWKCMAAFVLRCKDAGVQPLVSAFRYFFSVYTHKHQDKPLGWHYFQPCAGRRLFTGTLPTKYGWKSRFFFLKSPQGMPWKCPVAWGKPRMEDARTVELTDAAINKLKQMPCIDLKHFLSLHAPPVGALTLLQLHSTTAPMMKPESAAASAQALALTSLHQLHAALEAGARAPSAADAAGEGDDSTRRKRRGFGQVTLTPSLCTMLWWQLMLRSDCKIRSRRQMPRQPSRSPTFRTSCKQANAVNAKFMDYLVAARAENAQLKEKHACEIAKLNQEHASEVTKLNQEHASEATKVEVARVKHAAEEVAVDVVQDAKKDIVLALFPDLDASLLFRS
ncbi:unnamed protein product [Miscanthus lutarioriparius]|uniref:Transposase (putative) gypsy type domain-containing protein n=1 Tax=Miscanthus lutarioriparius TaxID=422564 RepID=A0A811ME15_9POAL|nr:unnamed protein product [Miscanthus lutarioriparius]